ncbi:hypothetical protein RhiirA4_428334 [Rhizophagus irregularis]|uniref:Uncharacterized protein n=1 Tax=Rhizophagus irregularis TaxID=588596 RepID=A0A2I1HCF9_9GLOM|nr:hypothetical protein RhiirA4_428334 [Rhizophagus irregularis]
MYVTWNYVPQYMHVHQSGVVTFVIQNNGRWDPHSKSQSSDRSRDLRFFDDHMLIEYRINFNNNNANENILSALAELNDIFFIENNSSSDEKSVLNNEVISNFSNVEEDTYNFDKNFNEIHLNSHEFVENNDSYIENKVYDDIKLKVKEFFDKGKCSYNPKCFKKIGYERFLIH